MDGGQEVLLEYKKHCNSLMLEKMPNKKKAALVFDFLKNLPMGEKFVALAGSGSMEPLVLKGDEVLIERVSFKSLKKGDVIAFWHQELKNVVVHRFHSLEKGKIITKGDGNLYSDMGYVDRKNFLGLMIKVV
jgi:signal peptidase I